MELFTLTNFVREILQHLTKKSKPEAEKTYVVTGYIYTGYAPAGSSVSDAVWKVSRTTDTTPFITTWANGGAYANVMNDYATLKYS